MHNHNIDVLEWVGNRATKWSEDLETKPQEEQLKQLDMFSWRPRN